MGDLGRAAVGHGDSGAAVQLPGRLWHCHRAGGRAGVLWPAARPLRKRASIMQGVLGLGWEEEGGGGAVVIRGGVRGGGIEVTEGFFFTSMASGARCASKGKELEIPELLKEESDSRGSTSSSKEGGGTDGDQGHGEGAQAI
ncbi:hypothetical protein R1flu_026607 [Riccia fluitans]|uniref:Uncharacterized protein n=1 Tax=Riccia fluitans TaxID=41844 RepID=A0ABD1XGE4_9MARC